MADEPFNFITEYRTLQPDAKREVLETREAAYKILIAEGRKSTRRALQICSLAFDLGTQPSEDFNQWFGQPITDADRFFSVDHDRAEAQRMASLVLRSWVALKAPWACSMVVTTSFGGRRANDFMRDVVTEATAQLAQLARSRSDGPTVPKIEFPKALDRKATFEKVVAEFAPGTVRPALEAVAADIQSQGGKFASSLAGAIQTVIDDNRRLSEEVNLLWWHLSEYCDLFDCANSEVPKSYFPLVAGADLARMVEDLPGVYGALGIVRRALGSDASSEISITEALKSIPDGHISKLREVFKQDTQGLFPLSYGLHLDAKSSSFADQFKASTGIDGTLPLSNYEIAAQSYREAMFQLHGWGSV